MADNHDAIALDGVSKSYDAVKAVADLTFRVKRGAMFGLLGPNGAGKTTVLRMVMRIMAPDTGSIRLFGRPLDAGTQELIGYLPEERGLYPRMPVRKVIVFLASLKGLSERQAGRCADEWLERFDLSAWAGKKVIDLSKGMQQKVQFIAAVLHRPPLLALDEPFSGLDPVNVVLVKDIMLEMRQQGATIVLSTHRMEQVEMMCDSICLINKGRNILHGDLRAIKQSYGKNTLRIEYSGDGDFLERTGLVLSVNRFGSVVEARLSPGADPQEILKAAVMNGVRLHRFELIEPPLNDIFIEEVSRVRA